MKVKVIGTGAITSKERNACTLIDEKILVDCGNGIVKTLMEQDVDILKIDTLLITHLHGDHFLDIPFLILYRRAFAPEKALNVYCPKGTTDIIGKLINLGFPDAPDWNNDRIKANVEFKEFDRLDNIEVTPGYIVNSYNVEHSNMKSAYGYTIEAEGKVVGLSGDSSYCKTIEEIVEISDVSVLDTSLETGNEKHMGINDIKVLLDKYGKTIISTHINTKTRQIANEYKIDNWIIPKDGEEFTY